MCAKSSVRIDVAGPQRKFARIVAFEVRWPRGKETSISPVFNRVEEQFEGEGREEKSVGRR